MTGNSLDMTILVEFYGTSRARILEYVHLLAETREYEADNHAWAPVTLKEFGGIIGMDSKTAAKYTKQLIEYRVLIGVKMPRSVTKGSTWYRINYEKLDEYINQYKKRGVEVQRTVATLCF